MPRFIKLYTQFLGFVYSLDPKSLSSYEKKLVNLFLRHFDEIKEKGTQMGQRSKHIYGLIEAHGDTVPSEISIPLTSIQEGDISIKKLKSLELEHFRGFADKETFDLSKQYTFIYGPNGSGKSSMFEALEFSMLGFMQGAIDKNIELSKYMRNQFTGKQVYPILYGFVDEKSADVVKINPKYSFCFIEKSRIDQFARISANTEREKEKRLAILFGLDEFNKFVNDFTRDAEKYFQVEKKKEKEFAEKSAGVERTKASIAKEKTTLEAYKIALQKIVTEAGCDSTATFEERYVKAPEGGKTKLEELTEQLKSAAPQLLSFEKVDEIQKQLETITGAVDSLMTILGGLLAKKSDIQFKDLFSAAIVVETPSAKACPLCETPFDQVHVHPFDNARAKLETLQEVIRLETEAETTYAALYVQIQGFESVITALDHALITGGKGSLQFIPATLLEKNKSNMTILVQRFRLIQEGFAADQARLDADQKDLEKLNESIKAQNEARKTIEIELVRAQSFKENYAKELALFSNSESRIEGWEKEVVDFEKSNVTDIVEIKAENEKVERNEAWLAAYQSVREKLAAYMEGLPINYVGELSGMTCEIFNRINHLDRDYEKAESITLPKSADEGISIKFVGLADKYDALCILSEGHLRCLGLAILIAKNIKEGCPVLIFDDIVNAIDTEHRGGIRDLLFHYEPLQDKQVIVTTHDDDFATKLALKVSSDSVGELVQAYSFATDEAGRRILVDKDSRNHLHKAFEEYSKNKVFEAMKTCRLALESIGYELWRKLSREQRPLIKGAYPTGRPDLNSLISGLNKFIKDKNLEKYKTVCEHLDFFLRQDIWDYFNKASHEGDDRPSLDKDVVKEILDKCTLVDGMLKITKKAKLELGPPKVQETVSPVVRGDEKGQMSLL